MFGWRRKEKLKLSDWLVAETKGRKTEFVAILHHQSLHPPLKGVTRKIHLFANKEYGPFELHHITSEPHTVEEKGYTIKHRFRVQWL